MADDLRGVCVIGRADFQTGIGTVTASALEMFARSGPVVFCPGRNGVGMGSTVTLPGGRSVPVVQNPEGYAAYFYTDVLWNGIDDFGYARVPREGLRIAHIAYDSDVLPPEWVRLLNERFDVALFMSAHLVEVARSSGVEIALGTLPLALDLEPLLSRSFRPPLAGKVRFGTVTAFHERKGLDVLVDAFLEAFSAKEDVELVIHSNLAMGHTYERIKARVASVKRARVRISYGDLSTQEKNDLIETFDVYVNTSSGEGYSIGPREALALGKPLVLSGIGAHQDMDEVPGVILVPSSGRVPARYGEIDNRVFGTQQAFDRDDVAGALRSARAFALTHESSATTHLRKVRAAEFSMTKLEPDYRAVTDPDAPQRPASSGSSYSSVSEPAKDIARMAAGRHGSRVQRRKIVVQSHDAGFFSLFNVFASHLTWSMQESSPPMVLPDWDVSRLLERTGNAPLVSYCYSKPEDGNMWSSLFEPLYDLTEDDLNDVDFLYGGSEFPDTIFNENKEPLLTYTNAFDLYRAPWFSRFRRQYNSVVRDRVRLRSHYQQEVDGLQTALGGRFVVAAHVKHPSHSVEQPGGAMAERHQYVTEVRNALHRRGISESSDDWGVFVATDQERVVDLFAQEFGDHVIRFDDVSRIDVATDLAFDELDPEAKHQDGHQLQHLLAADSSSWSTRLAWEVWRDAEAMAASDVLIHAVSNVATAVSYLGDRVQMVYCEPD